MKKISIWKDNLKVPSYPKLDSDKEVDVLIIGGGISGTSIYYHLKDTNLKIMLVEQRKICMSTTSGSTGKLSFMQNDLIDKIRNSCNDDAASLYLKSQIEAINLAVNIIHKEKIKCDLEKVDSIIYTNQNNEINSLKKLEMFLKNNNINISHPTLKLVRSKYTISVGNTYHLHPVKLVYGLLRENNNIYEMTSIKKIIQDNNSYICYTDKNKIKAKWVIIASHYPYFNLPYFFPIKGYLEKSYLSASKYQKIPLSLISYKKPVISIRNYCDYLIYLSNSHDINTSCDDTKNFMELQKKVHDLKLEPEYMWSNTDIITNDGLPYIGKIKDNMLIATGYNTWGIATSILAGKIIRDIILNKENEYIELFNPKRKNISQITGGICDIYKNITGYIKGLQKQNEILRKCPHMGCHLLLNKEENTWDCPCHGSRFNIDGECIMGPSNQNIKIMYKKTDSLQNKKEEDI